MTALDLKKLSPKRGDIVVWRFRGRGPTSDQVQMLCTRLRQDCGEGITVISMPEGSDLSIMDSETRAHVLQALLHHSWRSLGVSDDKGTVVQSRRVARLDVGEELIATILREGVAAARVSRNPLPADTRVVGASFDATSRVLSLLLESDHFALVPPTEAVPHVPAIQFTRDSPVLSMANHPGPWRLASAAGDVIAIYDGYGQEVCQVVGSGQAAETLLAAATVNGGAA